MDSRETKVTCNAETPHRGSETRKKIELEISNLDMLPDSVGDVTEEHGDDGAGEDGQQTDQAACKIEMG